MSLPSWVASFLTALISLRVFALAVSIPLDSISNNSVQALSISSGSRNVANDGFQHLVEEGLARVRPLLPPAAQPPRLLLLFANTSSGAPASAAQDLQYINFFVDQPPDKYMIFSNSRSDPHAWTFGPAALPYAVAEQRFEKFATWVWSGSFPEGGEIWSDALTLQEAMTLLSEGGHYNPPWQNVIIGWPKSNLFLPSIDPELTYFFYRPPQLGMITGLMVGATTRTIRGFTQSAMLGPFPSEEKQIDISAS